MSSWDVFAESGKGLKRSFGTEDWIQLSRPHRSWFRMEKMFLYYMDFVPGLQVRVTKYPNFRVLEGKKLDRQLTVASPVFR